MKKLRSPLLSVLVIYILCFIFRIIEYFIIRTDQTLLGEAIIHKIAGIIILWIAIKMLSSDFEYIGFKRKGIFKNIALGLLFGISVFAAAYGVEILIAVSQGNFQSLQFYVSSYAVDKNMEIRPVSCSSLFVLLVTSLMYGWRKAYTEDFFKKFFNRNTNLLKRQLFVPFYSVCGMS